MPARVGDPRESDTHPSGDAGLGTEARRAWRSLTSLSRFAEPLSLSQRHPCAVRATGSTVLYIPMTTTPTTGSLEVGLLVGLDDEETLVLVDEEVASQVEFRHQLPEEGNPITLATPCCRGGAYLCLMRGDC